MAKYLVKDGSRFYFRIRVPHDLKHSHPGKTYIKYALGTSDSKEAKRLVRLELAKVQRRFDQDRAYPPILLNALPRRTLSEVGPAELQRIATTVCLHHLEDDASTRTRISDPDELEKYNAERLE